MPAMQYPSQALWFVKHPQTVAQSDSFICPGEKLNKSYLIAVGSLFGIKCPRKISVRKDLYSV